MHFKGRVLLNWTAFNCEQLDFLLNAGPYLLQILIFKDLCMILAFASESPLHVLLALKATSVDAHPKPGGWFGDIQ